MDAYEQFQVIYSFLKLHKRKGQIIPPRQIQRRLFAALITFIRKHFGAQYTFFQLCFVWTSIGAN